MTAGNHEIILVFIEFLVTDGAGKIRSDEINPGTCEITEIVADTGAEVTG